MSESSSEVNPLDALAEEFVARHRRGERPSLDEFIARRPDLADGIRDLFPGLILMEGVRPDRGDSTGPFAPGPAPTLKRLGDFRILREVGRGGMGVVYEAEQESLGRHVALKVLPAHSLIEPQRLRRFQREAKAAARLHHTNIVPVYGVGEQDGLHYYVMQFINGLGLDQVLDELRKLRPTAAAKETPSASRGTASAASAAHSLLTGHFATAAPADPEAPPDSGGSSSVRLPGQVEGTPPSRTGREYWRSVARVGIQVGDALAYAHGQGVLHRDVKPSNLLLDGRGNVWVTDFGLAKAADSEDLTNTGDIVGTVRYMAPESFRGKSDARSDVYSLGLTLYELLTLRPAFVGKDGHQLLAEVVHGEPPRPRSVSRDIPHDLETVVLKAIARDPLHRYQGAAELADDLRRFVDDRPVRARRVGMAELAWRWARRNPAVACLTAAVLLLLVAGTAASAVAAYRFSVLADAQTKARADADHASIETQKKADQLLDDFKRINRANALMESARLHADAGQNDKALADYAAAVEQRPDVSVVWLTRGEFYLQYFCFDEAAADFERGFQLQPPADPSLWRSRARLRLYVGDRDGYRRVCAGMLDKFGQTTDPATMRAIADACTAGPDALEDYTPLFQLLDKPAAPEEDFRAELLSVYWRAGRAEQGVRQYEAWLQKGGVNWDGAVAALVYHAVGQDDKARQPLAELKQNLDSELAQVTQQEVSSTTHVLLRWYNLRAYLLGRELVQQLKGLGAVEHPLYWVACGRGRAALGQWDAAAADVARAIALQPADPQLHLEHSRMLAAQKRWDEAAADYEEVLRQHPDDGDLWLQRGRLYARQGRWEQAAADINRALEQPSFALYTIGDQPWPADMLQPDRLFDALARLRPRDAHLWAQRAVLLDQAAKESDAAAAYARAVEARPNDLPLLEERGMFFGVHERWDEAAADFARVLELLPDAPDLGRLEPIIYSQLQQWDHALDRTLALRPADGRLYAVRARWHAGRGEWDKAVAAFGEAVKLLPDETDLRRERGTLYAQLGRWKEAANDFDRIVAVRPFGEDWFRDACLRRLSGDADGCRKLCAQVVERYGKTTDGNDAYVAGHIVAVTAGAGVDPAAAVRWEERAVASQSRSLQQQSLITDPGDFTDAPQSYSLHALGLAHLRAGRRKAALRWFGESRNMAEGSPAALNQLGLALAYDGLNQPDEARKVLDEAANWLLKANADRPRPDADFAPNDMPLSDWLEYQLLRREAEAALKEPAPKPDK